MTVRVHKVRRNMNMEKAIGTRTVCDVQSVQLC